MSPELHELFFHYPLTPFDTSAGPIALPILYHDCSVLMALYLVDVDRVAPLLTDPRLSVAPMAGGKALVATAFYEYRQTAIGAYNELGVAVAVIPRGFTLPRWPLLSLLRSPDHSPMGLFIVDLPVTTAIACAAGREVWGYPKFVTDIRFALDERGFAGAVVDPDGGDILTLDGMPGPSMPGPLLDLVLYSSHQEGPLLRTLVQTRGGARVGLPGSLTLRVPGTARHPMAERLRHMGLDGARPFSVSASHRLQLRLNAGAPMP